MIGFLIAIGIAICLIIGVFIMFVIIGAGMIRRGTAMPNSKPVRIILTVVILLVVVGVLFVCWMLATKDERGEIKVKSEKGNTGATSVEKPAAFSLDRCEYTVMLEKASRAAA